MHDTQCFPSMKGSPEDIAAERGRAPQGARPPAPAVKAEVVCGPVAASRSAGSAFQAWPEIRAQLRGASHWALLLDFDGTLVNLRRRPDQVRLSAQARRVLQRLVRHARVFVAIISGRRLGSLQSFVDVQGLHYFGLHGAEREGQPAKLTTEACLALNRAKRDAQMRLGAIPGVWIEDKGPSFSVHYRDADAASVASARAALGTLLAPWGHVLRVLNGSRVWEVLPREICGKSAAVEEVLAELPAATAVVYIGDDGTDEAVFAVLADKITVRVGCDPGTRARYSVPAPADVLRFLARVERELP
jgi:trehalose 6-phosphate phosphatase